MDRRPPPLMRAGTGGKGRSHRELAHRYRSERSWAFPTRVIEEGWLVVVALREETAVGREDASFSLCCRDLCCCDAVAS